MGTNAFFNDWNLRCKKILPGLFRLDSLHTAMGLGYSDEYAQTVWAILTNTPKHAI